MGIDTVGKNVAATGCLNTAGKFVVSSSSVKNVMAMTRYLRMKNSKEARVVVDTSAVVAGCEGPAIGDTAKFGVAATDAGTNCGVDGKSYGDANPVEVVEKVVHTIFAFGGAGFTICVTSTSNMAEVVEW